MTEIWKPIPDYPGYDVSSCGRVRSYRTRKGAPRGQWRVAKRPQRVLAGGPDTGNYQGVCLRINGKTCRRRVGYLVLLAFAGPRPEGMWVCREDFDPQNDNVDNLRYDTPAGSAAGMPEEIKRARGIHKLTDQQVVEIRTRYAADKKLTHKELAVEHNVTTGAIDRACTGKSYSYLDGPRTIHKFQPRVSDQIAQTILLRLNFETARSLAEEYGIHESTISRWKNGTNRRELTNAS